MSNVVGLSADRITDDVVGLAPNNDSLNIFGDTAGGERVRYYWEPDFNGDWLAENLFEESIPV
jgi:hypothetical protein